MRAELARSTAMRSAVLPRVQPNHEKPMIIVPIAPTTTPHAAGLNQGACSSITRPFAFLDQHFSLSELTDVDLLSGNSVTSGTLVRGW